MAKVALGLVFACGLAGAAWAQTATDAALPVTPAKLALAQQIIEANGAQAAVKQLVQSMMAQMEKGLNVSGDQKLAAFTTKVLRDEMNQMLTKMQPLYAGIYARSFDEQQLSDLLTFYKSPTGQMLAEKLPEVARQSQLAVAPLIPQMQKDTLVRIFDGICQVKTCTPAMHNQLAEAKQRALERLDAQAAASAQSVAKN